MGILITFLLGIFLLTGVLVVRLARGSKVIEQFSISIALGTMCSLAMIELIPEIFETFHGKNLLFAGIAVLVGILGLKALDHFTRKIYIRSIFACVIRFFIAYNVFAFVEMISLVAFIGYAASYSRNVLMIIIITPIPVPSTDNPFRLL